MKVICHIYSNLPIFEVMEYPSYKTIYESVGSHIQEDQLNTNKRNCRVYCESHNLAIVGEDIFTFKDVSQTPKEYLESKKNTCPYVSKGDFLISIGFHIGKNAVDCIC